MTSGGSGHATRADRCCHMIYPGNSFKSNYTSKSALAFLLSTSFREPKEPWEPRGKTDASADYTPTFLSHAKLYVFADRYGVKHPASLVLHKLCFTLARFKLYQQRIPDIVELLKYTYYNKPSIDNTIDPLRALVTEYVACVAKKVTKHAAFTDLMHDQDEVAKDLLPRLVLRLE